MFILSLEREWFRSKYATALTDVIMTSTIRDSQFGPTAQSHKEVYNFISSCENTTD